MTTLIEILPEIPQDRHDLIAEIVTLSQSWMHDEQRLASAVMPELVEARLRSHRAATGPDFVFGGLPALTQVMTKRARVMEMARAIIRHNPEHGEMWEGLVRSDDRTLGRA